VFNTQALIHSITAASSFKGQSPTAALFIAYYSPYFSP